MASNGNRSRCPTAPAKLIIPAALAAGSMAAPAPGQCPPPIETDHLVASDGMTGDDFGRSVSIADDGNRALIGAPYDDNAGGADAGAVYIYVRSGLPGNRTWTQLQRLVASVPGSGDSFGYAVAISADGATAIIGAPFDDNAAGVDAGAAYVFTRSGAPGNETWTERQRLGAPDAAPGDRFGWSVAISEDGATIIIGAPEDDTTAGADAGSAHVFIRSGPPGGETWTPQQQLVGPPRLSGPGDRFGEAVSLSADGDTAVIGAPYNDLASPDNGAAHFFGRSGTTWSHHQGVALSPFNMIHLGASVAMSGEGDTALIGAPDYSDGPYDGGAAYVFWLSGGFWFQQAQLTGPIGAGEEKFGTAIALSGDGDTAIIGSPYEDHLGLADPGAAYLYTRSGSAWTRIDRFTSCGPTPGAGDLLGRAAAISADGITMIAGAAGDESGFTFRVLSFDPDEGGCCLGGQCIETREEPCTAAGGTFLGIGVACAPGPGRGPGSCEPPPDDCPSDITGDDRVNVSDLLRLLADWGLCP
jgi:hypothetical protein